MNVIMLKRKRYCSRDSSDDINLNLTKKKKHDSLSLIKNSSSISNYAQH